jgi:hypothetical protein
MVGARKALETLYDGRCDIIAYQKIRKENKSTGFCEVTVHRGIPCRRSYNAVSSANPSDMTSVVTQGIKLFLAPEIPVKAGSKIVVTQNGVTTEYKSSGEPAIYTAHQEIALELFKGWA